MIIKTVNILKDHYLQVNKKIINLNVLLSCFICLILIIIAITRNLSYSPNSWFVQMVKDTPLYFFTYQPDNYYNVQFIKILATPSIIAILYFLFRDMNNQYIGTGKFVTSEVWHKIDFSPVWFRVILTTVITVCWIPMEAIKFYYRENFYPFSVLEDQVVNIIVLLCGQLISIVFMQHLSFKQLIVPKENFSFSR